jgi:CRP/FNR family cyclic AMP-dependent transcriptional regulator
MQDAEPLLKPLLDAIAARGGVRQFPAHAILINEGDSTDSLYIVLAGRVKAYGTSESGREVVLAELGVGEYFGELSLDGAPRSVSVKTIEPTTCSVVQGSRLREFLADHPDFALHLTHKLMRMVRRLTEQVKSLALQDVYGRVVRLLAELSEPDGDVRAIPHKLTQQDIADRVGSSREMVSRIFKDLQVGGYVAVQDKRIVLLKKPPAAW